MLSRICRAAAPRTLGATSAPAFLQSRSKATVVDTGKTYDTLYEDVQINKEDKAQRAFTYLTLGGARFLYASAGRLAVMKFVATMSASADVLALSSLEVDVNKVDPGKPIFNFFLFRQFFNPVLISYPPPSPSPSPPPPPLSSPSVYLCHYLSFIRNNNDCQMER
jgi:hypothetical protein